MVLSTFGFVIAERATNDYPRELSESMSLGAGASAGAGGTASTVKTIAADVVASIQLAGDRSFTEALALVVEAGLTGQGALLAEDSLAFASDARQSATASQAQGAAISMAAAASITALTSAQLTGQAMSFTGVASIQLTGNVAAVELFQAIAAASLTMESSAMMDAVLPFGSVAAFDAASGRMVDELMALGVQADFTAADFVTLRNTIQLATAANLVALGLARTAKDMELASQAGLDLSSFHTGPAELMSLAAEARLASGAFKVHNVQLALEALASMASESFITSKAIEGVCNVAGFILQHTDGDRLQQGGIVAAALEAHTLADMLEQHQVAQFKAGATPGLMFQGSATHHGQARGEWLTVGDPGVSVIPGLDDSMTSGAATATQSGGVSFFRFLRCN